MAQYSEELLEMVYRQALMVLKVAPKDREAHYRVVAQACHATAKELGLSEAESAGWAARVVALTRSLVETIERTGGGCGGHA